MSLINLPQQQEQQHEHPHSHRHDHPHANGNSSISNSGWKNSLGGLKVWTRLGRSGSSHNKGAIASEEAVLEAMKEANRARDSVDSRRRMKMWMHESDQSQQRYDHQHSFRTEGSTHQHQHGHPTGMVMTRSRFADGEEVMESVDLSDHRTMATAGPSGARYTIRYSEQLRQQQQQQQGHSAPPSPAVFTRDTASMDDHRESIEFKHYRFTPPRPLSNQPNPRASPNLHHSHHQQQDSVNSMQQFYHHHYRDENQYAYYAQEDEEVYSLEQQHAHGAYSTLEEGEHQGYEHRYGYRLHDQQDHGHPEEYHLQVHSSSYSVPTTPPSSQHSPLQQISPAHPIHHHSDSLSSASSSTSSSHSSATTVSPSLERASASSPHHHSSTSSTSSSSTSSTSLSTVSSPSPKASSSASSSSPSSPGASTLNQTQLNSVCPSPSVTLKMKALANAQVASSLQYQQPHLPLIRETQALGGLVSTATALQQQQQQQQGLPLHHHHLQAYGQAQEKALLAAAATAASSATTSTASAASFSSGSTVPSSTKTMTSLTRPKAAISSAGTQSLMTLQVIDEEVKNHVGGLEGAGAGGRELESGFEGGCDEEYEEEEEEQEPWCSVRVVHWRTIKDGLLPTSSHARDALKATIFVAVVTIALEAVLLQRHKAMTAILAGGGKSGLFEGGSGQAGRVMPLLEEGKGGPFEISFFRPLDVYYFIFILAEVFAVGLLWDAAIHKNSLQLVAFTLFEWCMVSYSGLQIWQHDNLLRELGVPVEWLIQIEDSTTRLILFTQLGVQVAASLGITLLTWRLYSEFGWLVFQKLGADVSLRKMMKEYRLLFTLLKLDAFFFFGYAIQIAVLTDKHWQKGLTEIAFAIPLSMIIIGLGFCALRKENKVTMLGFITCLGLLFAYMIYRLVALYQSLTGDPDTDPYFFSRKTMTVFASLTLLMTVLALWNAIVMYLNFNKGLKEAMVQYRVRRSGTIRSITTTASSTAGGGSGCNGHHDRPLHCHSKQTSLSCNGSGGSHAGGGNVFNTFGTGDRSNMSTTTITGGSGFGSSFGNGTGSGVYTTGSPGGSSAGNSRQGSPRIGPARNSKRISRHKSLIRCESYTAQQPAVVMMERWQIE